MKIELSIAQALRLLHLIELGKSQTKLNEVIDVANEVESQVNNYIEELDETIRNIKAEQTKG